jgi:hypothetical protein
MLLIANRSSQSTKSTEAEVSVTDATLVDNARAVLSRIRITSLLIDRTSESDSAFELILINAGKQPRTQSSSHDETGSETRVHVQTSVSAA